METSELLIYFLIFALLPIWGVAGFVDWLCHKATKIETTSGVKESLMHSLMGIQIGIPIVLCLVYEVNVLILLICIAVWILHELVAHWDVTYATPKRVISIWEMHAHNYLATLPMYMLITIIIINWPVFLKMVSLDWQSQMSLELVASPHGGEHYLVGYLSFMAIFCIFPYIEELTRCLVAMAKNQVGDQ